MTIEAQLDRIAQTLEEIVRTMQQTINPLVEVAGQRATSTSPQSPAPNTVTPMMPEAQTQAAAPAPSAASAADNVISMQPPGGALTREQLNGELMAVVAKLGGGPNAAAQVMNVLTSKYGTASLQGITEDKFPALLADVQALVGG